MSAAYAEVMSNFKSAVKNFINTLDSKVNKVSLKNITSVDPKWTISLADSTIYVNNAKNGITDLTLHYPEGDFICTLIFTTAKSGTLNINLPENSVLVGRSRLDFFNNETWELNIHNGRIVAMQLFNV